jgi:hypothetical protein
MTQTVLTTEIMAERIQKTGQASNEPVVVNRIRLKEIGMSQRQRGLRSNDRQEINPTCPLVEPMTPSTTDRFQGFQAHVAHVADGLQIQIGQACVECGPFRTS